MHNKQERTERMQMLIQANRQRREKEKEFSSLLQECLDVLGDGTVILSDDKTEQLYKQLASEYPVSWFTINWSEVENKVKIHNPSDARSFLINQIELDDEIYVLWSHGDDPALQIRLEKGLENLDDILISSDVWFYSPDKKYVIEFYHEGNVHVGFRD